VSKNILITGVSRGLGLATARAVLRKGWSVYGLSRSHSCEYESLQLEFSDRAHYCSIDLSQADNVKNRIFSEFLPVGVPIHGFVNNAAVVYDDLVSNLDLEQLRALFEINVFTPMVLTKYTIRNMLLHSLSGSIVHISSISVHTGYKGLAMYASTKGALEAFSRNTAREWGERDIRSNCVVAGFMETDMTSSLTEEQRQKIYKRTALKRATSLESVACTVVHLLGEESTSITGQNIYVDSGTI
jgi:3-oxoacyl-[acyl-carrier protein] reductase